MCLLVHRFISLLIVIGTAKTKILLSFLYKRISCAEEKKEEVRQMKKSGKEEKIDKTRTSVVGVGGVVGRHLALSDMWPKLPQPTHHGDDDEGVMMMMMRTMQMMREMMVFQVIDIRCQ